MRLVLSSVVLIACGSKPEPPQPTPTPTPAPSPTISCEATIDEAAKRIAAESKRVDLDPKAERIKLTMIASCEAEPWPAVVMSCIAAARLDVDLDACTDQLTHAQWVKLHDKIAALNPPAPPPAPTIAVAPRPAPKPQNALLEPRSLRPANPDCSKAVANPTNRACVQQFCQGHPRDARCEIE